MAKYTDKVVELGYGFHVRKDFVKTDDLDYNWDDKKAKRGDEKWYSSELNDLYIEFMKNESIAENQEWTENFFKEIEKVLPGTLNDPFLILITGIRYNSNLVNQFLKEAMEYVYNEYCQDEVISRRHERMTNWITILTADAKNPRKTLSPSTDLTYMKEEINMYTKHTGNRGNIVLKHWVSKPGGLKDFIITIGLVLNKIT